MHFKCVSQWHVFELRDWQHWPRCTRWCGTTSARSATSRSTTTTSPPTTWRLSTHSRSVYLSVTTLSLSTHTLKKQREEGVEWHQDVLQRHHRQQHGARQRTQRLSVRHTSLTPLCRPISHTHIASQFHISKPIIRHLRLVWWNELK